MTAQQDPAENPNRLTFRLPSSAGAWFAVLLCVVALLVGLSTSGETLSRWVPGLIAFVAVFLGLRAGVSHDERSLFMWVPLVLTGTYLFLLMVTSGF